MATTGNRGKFSDRLKRISLLKRKKNTIAEIQDSDVIYKNFLKVVSAIPLMVYDNVVNLDSNADKKDVNKKVSSSISHDDTFASNLKNSTVKKTSISKKRDLIDKIDVSFIKKRQNDFYSNSIVTDKNNIKETKINNDASALEKEIINLIKKNLIKTVNELEILQSELYLISEVNGDEKTLKECQKTLDEVKKMLCKIDILKKKYDFLKDNYDFEYMLELDDNLLADKIIELKDNFSNNEVKATVVDYKLLDVYKYLYLRIDKLQEESIQFEEYKESKLQELKDRDIDFDKLKSGVYNVSRVNEDYNMFVKNQNDYLADLSEKVHKINSYEDVSYKLKGFGQFALNSFKYLGLLMMTPLKGVIPSIATETLITRNVVRNLYNNIEMEETRKMVYEGVDYSSVIRNAIDDLDYTGRMVDATLEDIVKLKIKYNEQFKKYQGDFLEYENFIAKINDMENKILGNKIKIEIMKKKMKEKEKANAKKLELVKELNEKASSNNN